MSKKKKKAQIRILNEIRDQLVLQAERWGRTNYYTPLKLEELVLEQSHKIKGDFLAERSNLEYEMNLLGTDKREVLIKIERLESYIKKADRTIESHERNISRLLDKMVGDKQAISLATSYLKKKSLISVMIGR
jgi:hypothetical protein